MTGRRLRLATYNVEWFDRLFDEAGRPMPDGAARRAALGAVFGALDADAVVVIEAPRARPAPPLAAFARAWGLRARAVLMGAPSGTAQEVALLFDPDRIEARLDPQGLDGQGPPPFDASFRVDPGDGQPIRATWARPPIEAAIVAGALRLRLIGVHAKSKAPLGAHDEADARRIARENRRKQVAQCLWLRARVDRHLAAGEAVAVLGDLNDGPGLDEWERPLGRSGVEIVAGQGDARLHDPSLLDPGAATALFREPGGGLRPALLDFALASASLLARGPRWRVWHPDREPALAPALLAASDHFPVSLDLDA